MPSPVEELAKSAANTPLTVSEPPAEPEPAEEFDSELPADASDTEDAIVDTDVSSPPIMADAEHWRAHAIELRRHLASVQADLENQRLANMALTRRLTAAMQVAGDLTRMMIDVRSMALATLDARDVAQKGESQ